MNRFGVYGFTAATALSGLSTLHREAAFADTITKSRPLSLLRQAHRFSIQGNAQQTLRTLRDALVDPDLPESAKRNALDLANHLLSESCGKHFDLGWDVPSGIRGLKFSQVLIGEPDQSYFGFGITGSTDDADLIRQIRVTSARGRVVLDKVGQVGNWESSHEENEDWFGLKQEQIERPLEEGLYEIELEYKGEPAVKGWFLVSNMEAHDAPVVFSPKADAKVSPRPELEIEDFASNLYSKKCDKRSLAVYATKLPAGSTWMPRFRFWDKLPERDQNPTPIQVSLGDNQSTEELSDLDEGRYWLSVKFQERRAFGPITLGRESKRSFAFQVVK